MAEANEINLEFQDDEQLAIERYLDQHPDFAADYFKRKGMDLLPENWLPPNETKTAIPAIHGVPGKNSVSSSNSRKESAQDYQEYDFLHPFLPTNSDDDPIFLKENFSIRHTRSRRTKSQLRLLDERELLYELIMDVCNELDTTALCHKILQSVSMLVKADRCSLFLVCREANGERYLTSTLFDINSESTLKDSLESITTNDSIRVSWGSGIIGHVAKTGETLNITDAYEDSRFNRGIDTLTGYKTRSILSMPVKDADGEVIGVAQAVNKNSPNGEPFNEYDEKIFSSYLAFCGVGIRNAQLFERSQLENKRNQILLELARFIFQEQRDVASLIKKIMKYTRSLVKFERCTFLLLDDKSPGTILQVFDLHATDIDDEPDSSTLSKRDSSKTARFPIHEKITSQVAKDGEIVNIPDAYSDSRFDSTIDQKESNFKTKSILCLPIKNSQNQVIGIIQMVNKLDGTTFNTNDVNLMEAFAIFCGIGIHNTHMYEIAIKANAKQQVALEVLSYHAQAPIEDIEKLTMNDLESNHLKNLLYDYKFDDKLLNDDETLKACVQMFIDLELINNFRIEQKMFCHWLLSVKKNYRNVIYHNWRHAFNVAHTMFWMLTEAGMGNFLSDIEKLALLIGCLCHDLDHRGTNNQFQIKTMSPLAQLYSTSVMERHHFDHSIMILSTKGTNILHNLPTEKFEKVIKLLEHAILSTDLAVYFNKRSEFFSLVEKQDDVINLVKNDEKKETVRAMMMTACDIAAITKPWKIQKRISSLIAGEFFEQGDKEKTELKITPIDMMNREKKELFPSMQIGFIDGICLPIYQAFNKFNPKLNPLLEGCQANRKRWNKRKVNCKNNDDDDDDDDYDNTSSECNSKSTILTTKQKTVKMNNCSVTPVITSSVDKKREVK